MNTRKTRNNVAKIIIRPEDVERVAIDTLDVIADMVGATLGPGGRPVLCERDEPGLPAFLSKDGVTVFRHLGFNDPAQDAVMEVTRDTAVRTATEAGDGPQPLWSKILTPDGFVAMKDVQVGMKICGSNGTTQTVVGVYPKGPKRLVRVTFGGGRQVECCEDHLWAVTTHYGASKVLTTAEIRQDFVINTASGRMFRYYVQKAGPVTLRDGEHWLDPYLVGVLIGDGSLNDSGSIELSLGKPKEHIIEKLQSKLPPGLFTKSTWVPEKNAFRVKIQGITPSGETIRQLVERVGLRNCNSHSKFIPVEYLFGSVSERREVLQGLIDTDGYIGPRGRFEFSTVSDRLAEDFRSLCWGLGISLWYGLLTREDDPDSYSDSPIHRFHELKGNKYGDKIVNVEVTDIVTDMQCIKVSGDDHLYITDNYILTHNTTSSTILAAALVKNTLAYCRKNPSVSKQRVVRRLAEMYNQHGADFLLGISVSPQREEDGKYGEEARRLLKAVAAISANGDEELAEAAVSAVVDIAGDFGNVVISEAAGESFAKADAIKGYSMDSGFEDSCGHLAANFINDSGSQRCVLDRPRVICYNGRLTQTSSVMNLFNRINEEWTAYSNGNGEQLLAVAVAEGLMEAPKCSGRSHNTPAATCGKPMKFLQGEGWVCSSYPSNPTDGIKTMTPEQVRAFERYKASISKEFVLFAHGFGDEFVNACMMNWMDPENIHVFPVRIPMGPSPGHSQQVLLDVAAFAGARALDPVTIATNKFRLADLGPGVAAFEARRSVSCLLGEGREHAWSDELRKGCTEALLKRVKEVEKQAKESTSTLDKGLVLMRLAKITGGLAQITILGSSNSEIRERKDRAEDAVCAVRGAMKSGCLPGGGWGLLALASKLQNTCTDEQLDRPILDEILLPALKAPIEKLYFNAGFAGEALTKQVQEFTLRVSLCPSEAEQTTPPAIVYDLVTQKWVDAYEVGLLDSAPAVVEAIRSAVSIALTLGTCGGMILHQRDSELERQEARAASAYLRNANHNVANERDGE